MRLSELVRRSEIDFGRAGSSDDPDLTDITFDSREAGPGTLFVALRGASSDGHDYIPAAIECGVSAVLVASERLADFDRLSVPVLTADSPRRILGPLAASFFDHPSKSMFVIGITGTNGKTTVSHLIAAVLNHLAIPTGVIGTVGYRWRDHFEPAPNTTPESLVIQRLLARMRDDGVRVVAMEVSSHGLATHRVEGTSFAAGVFTNLSQDHLDFHGSMQDYRDTKRLLFTEHLARSSGVAILNVDDPEGRELLELLGEAVTTSATGQESDWRCTQWTQDLGGTHMSVDVDGGTLDVTTPLLGGFNVSNVLQTMAATRAVGVVPGAAAMALRHVQGVRGRMQHICVPEGPSVFVDYAHTPDALERALETLRPLTPGRLVVVFGCGGDRDRDKRAVMGAIAQRCADKVVLTSDNPRTEDPEAILDDIAAGLATGEAVREVDRAIAIRDTIIAAAPDDVILVAGKGHETYQEVSGVRHAFDDLDHARRALESRS